MQEHLLFQTDGKFSNYYLETEKNTIKHLPLVNSLNIFIGTNNSGKSRFLRELMNSLEFEFVDVTAYTKYLKFIEDNQNMDTIMPSLAFRSITNSNERLITAYKHSYYFDLKGFSEKLESLRMKSIERVDNNGYYIPTLRSAHALYSDDKNKIENDIYSVTLNKNYSFKNTSIKIFTGLHLYKEILNARNSKKEIRKRFEEFEKFLSINFFEGREVDVVAEFDKDASLNNKNSEEIISVHIAGGKDRFLYELGDGIQAIIVLMYQIFMAEPDSFIYIDEPELNLHPGMQRLFLEQLCYNKELKKKNLTYFITTHSNHFLDLTIEKDDVSIYAFSPRIGENGEEQFVIRNVNAGDNEILKNIGVNNSSVFMANCSIWVEGISDRNYIKAFLKAYPGDLLKEDIDYAFFEYAGSNIDHYFFGDLTNENEEDILKDINALALHNRIFLLADSDNAEAAKRVRLETLKAAKAGNFVPHIIEEIREIENLLTNDIWEQVLIEFCNKKLVEINRKEIIDKLSNALKKRNSQDFKKDYIGKFLSELNKVMKKIDDKQIINESVYKKKKSIGTFNLKRELSELVLEKVYKKEITWEHFSKNPHIEDLTETVYNFIKQSRS